MIAFTYSIGQRQIHIFVFYTRLFCRLFETGPLPNQTIYYTGIITNCDNTIVLLLSCERQQQSLSLFFWLSVSTTQKVTYGVFKYIVQVTMNGYSNYTERSVASHLWEYFSGLTSLLIWNILSWARSALDGGILSLVEVKRKSASPRRLKLRTRFSQRKWAKDRSIIRIFPSHTGISPLLIL